MGNNASKQGEKEKERDRNVPPSSPVVTHTTSNSTTSSRNKEPRSASIRQQQRDDTHSTPSAKSQTASQPLAVATTPQALQDPGTPKEDSKMGAEHSKQRKEEKASKAKAAPVRVPRGADPHRQRGPDSQFEPSGPPRDPNYIPHSNLNYPPRLPLPIREELHTPGSPMIDGQGDAATILHHEDIDGPIPRQSSAISSTTIEEDDLGQDIAQPSREQDDGYVPTTIVWRGGGDKIYVTGTFAQWSTKIRMHKDPNTGFYSTVLKLRPGTHHVKFIVDAEMQLSDDLPTAADFTNILVNYIEVSADDVHREHKPAERPIDTVPEGVHPPLEIPQTTDTRDHAPDSVGKMQPPDPQIKAEPVFWGKELPLYLRDVDKPENSNRFQRADRAIREFSTPPGLPLFLGKSILNGATPMKDDASVLNMPNHTVLNHLATSSIKNETLATSITTRFMRKYVTTIIYKPTEDSD